MSTTTETTEFESRLESSIKLKNVPNTEFVDGQFSIGDYFDREAFRESYEHGDELTEEDVDDWVEYAFDPWMTYCAGVDEIELTVDIEHGWIDIVVDVPESVDRQLLLANLIADAWEARKQR